ncbi:MAG: serine/threonine-protein kinase [Vulcanimicrobiota bacterium]
MEPGDLLQDRYKIVRHIKRGGMGAVYEARDTKLADSSCAVKEILEAARSSRDSQYIESRFFQEMKALAALDHPSIPKVRDYLTVDSVVYIVMELVQGQSLDDEIEQSVGLTGRSLPPEKCVEDVLALLETVEYLHQQEPPIIHRDIKPANVLRETRSGRIKLVDFGLARQLDDNSRHTLVGTLGYCAPEQMMGKGSFESDLYSVGMTLYHLLTGKQPDMLNLDALTPDLPGVRPGLAQIVEKATQPRPADRYHTCREMSDDLKAWLASEPPPKPLPSVPQEPPALSRYSPPAPAAASGGPGRLAGIGAVALALVLGLFMGRGTAPAATPTEEPSPVARLLPPRESPPPASQPAQPAVVPPTPVVAEAPPPPRPPKHPPKHTRRVAPVTKPAPAPVPADLPNPEIGGSAAPAYPTYQGPPIHHQPAVGFQVQEPPPEVDAGGPPAPEPPAFPQARPQRQPVTNQWRNRRNYQNWRINRRRF